MNLEYSLVFLGERNKKKILADISSNLKLAMASYQVIFLTKTPSKEKLSEINTQLNFKTIVFDKQASNDEMVETLVQTESLGTLILFRENYVNINFKDINKMIELNSRGNMLVVSKQNKKENVVTKVFKVIKTFFVRLLLGVQLFDGEADIVLLDRVLASTMIEMRGRSAALTKVNGWSGITPKYVGIDEQPKTKTKFPIKIFTPLIVISSIFMLLIITDIILSVLNVNIMFLGWFSLIAVQIGIFIMLIYSITKTCFRLKFGDISHVNQANILNKIDNFD